MAEKYNMAEKPVAQTAAIEDYVGPSKQLQAYAPKKSDPTEQHQMSYFFSHPPLSFRQVGVAIAQWVVAPARWNIVQLCHKHLVWLGVL